ncbi:MAG: DUF835 domain-containing protein [Methanomassiliicoccales archaeon]
MPVSGERLRISLVVEGYPRKGFHVLAKLMEGYERGLCITRLHPEYVCSKFDLKNVECYWLSGCKGKHVISPRSLGQLTRIVKTWLKENRDTVVFLDGLEYLLIWNDMGRIIGALNELDRVLSYSNSTMLICIDPLTLEQKDLEKISSVLKMNSAEELIDRLSKIQSQQICEALPMSADQTIGDPLQPRELHVIP